MKGGWVFPERFHMMQIVVASALAALCALLYTFAPLEKSYLLGGATMTLVGFVVGKFANGYRKAGQAEAPAIPADSTAKGE